MGLDVNALQPGVQLQSNLIVNPYADRKGIYRVNFAQKPDTITKNSEIAEYVNPDYISDAIDQNPSIVNILRESGMPVKINQNALVPLVNHHLPDTKKIVLGVGENLPDDYKSAVNYRALQEAASLHDIGKSLIPDSVVNKRGRLTDSELEIMQKHSILGYELLKNSDLSPETLQLVRNHHQNVHRTGYPDVGKMYVADINSQILKAADIYSALREERPYKRPMSKNEALAILHNEMKRGNVHPYVFKALVDYANKTEPLRVENSKRQVGNFKFTNCFRP